MKDLEIYNVDISRDFFKKFFFLKKPSTTKVLNGIEHQFTSIIKEDTGLNISVKNSWCNHTKFEQIGNAFPWHDHTGQGFKEAANEQEGTYSGILWLAGNEDSGGSLEVMINNDITSINFLPGKFITIKNNIFHKVSHYYGNTTRISLIVAFENKV